MDVRGNLDRSGYNPFPDILRFKNLRVLTIEHPSVLPYSELMQLQHLPALHTINFGLYIWREADSLPFLKNLITSRVLLKLKNINLRARYSWYDVPSPGFGWREDELKDWEIRRWNWRDSQRLDTRNDPSGEKGVHELFEVARNNGISVGGTVLDLDFPTMGMPKLLKDV